MPPEVVDGFEQLPTAEELGLENQLLALEIRVTRGQLRVMTEKMSRTESENRILADKLRKRPKAPEGMVLVSRESYDDLREAKRKLRWLLRRLGSGPLGWFVRTRSGYQNLASRWLDNSGGPGDKIMEQPAK